MSTRVVGGRFLPYEPGSTEYETDEYRGQRRRPYMVFRAGATINETTTDNLMHFVSKLHEAMIDNGVLLDLETEFLKYTITGKDYRLLQRELEEGLRESKHKYEVGPLSCPIVLLILDNYDHCQIDKILNHFADDMHFVKMEHSEILEMLQEDEFDELEQLCKDFGKYLYDSEGLPESNGIKVPTEELSIGFGAEYDVMGVLKKKEEIRKRCREKELRRLQQMEEERSQRRRHHGSYEPYNASFPPGLGPPGLQTSQQRPLSYRMAPPPGLTSHPVPRGTNEYQSQSVTSSGQSYEMQPPPGIPISAHPQFGAPSSSAAYNRNSNPDGDDIDFFDDGAQELKEPEIIGEHILSYDDVRFARKHVKDDDCERGIPSKDNKTRMAQYTNGLKMHNRFANPFVKLTHNLDLLNVINFAASSSEKKVHPDIKDMLRHVFRCGFPMKLKRRFLNRYFDRGDWTEEAAEMLFELFLLYFYTARFQRRLILGIEEFIPAWKDMVRSYCGTREKELRLAAVLPRELDNLKRLIEHIDMWVERAQQSDLDVSTSHDYDHDHRSEMSSRNIRSVSTLHGVVENEHSLHGNYAGYGGEERRMEHAPRIENAREREARLREETTYEQNLAGRSQNYQHDERINSSIIREESLREDRRRPEFQRSDGYYERARDEIDGARVNSSGRLLQREVFDERRDESLGFHKDGGTVDDEEKVVSFSNPCEPETVDEEVEEQPIVNTDEKPQQVYKFVQNEYEYEPLWKKFESMSPPEDFRILSTIPTLKDYMNTEEEPYLRRIQEMGVYKSAADYLDTQFRLLREDLVSSLRDGLDLYRKTGTCKGKRIEGIECSDVSIHTIERIDGKQVTERDGFEMRIAYPARWEMMNMMENETETREQGLAILSCDKFVNDYHLVTIASSFLNTKGCLHLVILESSCPLKPKTEYQMAQGKSYLPSYQFVLENMKRINPFKPIPFERYLVNGKKNIFRPSFHRFEKCEEQIAEETRLNNLYGDLRSIAVSQRIMKGKTIPGGMDDDDDADFSYNRKPKQAVEIDEEYEMLQEPIFRKHTGAESGASDRITIDNKWYSISKLLDDFHPDYLDESQRVAFCHTFKSEMSIIQGPPGTGKTHIGVKILKTMLQNRNHWRMTEPILIVCYTNSGLDNMLERVWQMIEDDEELSKDNGKPRMVRYGRKCESEFLRRRHVMRMDVNDQYRPSVSEKILREQSRTLNQKRKKADNLAVTSYSLFCSRKKLISYNVISRIMEVNHQNEIKAFAEGHVDSKEYSLSLDEAFACWLLDRDFGTTSKVQTSKNKKSKYKSLPEESDDEPLSVMEDSEDDDESELDDEQILDKLFQKMNLKCSGKELLGSANGDEADEYCTEQQWEIVGTHPPYFVALMGSKDKDGCPVDENIASLIEEVRPLILAAQPLAKEELEDIKFIFSLARPKRWALYNTWCAALRKLLAENLPKEIQEYRTACKIAQKGYEKIDTEIMKMTMVIGATTSGCSRLRPALEQAKPRILIVEEAAEVLEGHIVSAMISSIEHVVMIGDHKQLRPMPAVHALGTEYGLNISMFERLVERGLPYAQLKEQHRMNTAIANNIVRPAFYDNVHDAPNVYDYPDADGMASNLFFWSHAEKEETPDGVSWMNKREVEMVVTLVRYLLKQSYNYNDIVVLSTYSAQRNYLLREYAAVFGPENGQVSVETVDSFQGRESKIAIVSLVRSHRGIRDYTGIGFLAVANRICVALTRAQHGMYIVGNGEYLMAQSPLWKKIAKQLDKNDMISYDLPLRCSAHKNITKIHDPKDFAAFAPEGGCSEVCNIQKICGHVCQRQCHPNFEADHLMDCQYKCLNTCSNPDFRHECTKRCCENCGECMLLVEKDLNCGHRISTPCSRISAARCDQKCNKKLLCGHMCMNDCGAPCTEICQDSVRTELKCGHLKEVVCGLFRLGEADLKCVEKCSSKMMKCEHYCAELCGEQCTVLCQEEVTVKLECDHTELVKCCYYDIGESTAHISCTTTVSMNLKPCNHNDNVICGSEPSSNICSQPCQELLPVCNHECGDTCGTCFKTGKHVCQMTCNKQFDCGHSCTAKCGENCPPCKSYCANSCSHQSCGSGERAFGRVCYQICAMCTKTCSNRCPHRSCTKKCFEECDVKICNEPCENKLQCGHPCLGMCGEICPKVCGTCDRAKYNQCVSKIKGSTQKIHRLIMNPKCHDVYPVELLDEHVKKEKEENKQLTCPNCKSFLIGVLRYAKYEKKRVIEINTKNMRAASKHIDSQQVSAAILCKTDLTRSVISKLRMNQSNEVHKIILEFDRAFKEVRDAVESIAGKAEHKWRLMFYADVIRCFHAVAKLLESGSFYRIFKKKEIPPTTDLMMYRVFADNSFSRMITELGELNKHFIRDWKTDMIGAVMPKLRFQVAKMTILNEVTTMCYQLKYENRDISEPEARQIATSCSRLFCGNERQNVTGNLEPIEATLMQIAPNMSKLPSYYNWKKLSVPTF